MAKIIIKNPVHLQNGYQAFNFDEQEVYDIKDAEKSL